MCNRNADEFIPWPVYINRVLLILTAKSMSVNPVDIDIDTTLPTFTTVGTDIDSRNRGFQLFSVRFYNRNSGSSILTGSCIQDSYKLKVDDAEGNILALTV